jgi:hypothetical protein
MTLPCVGDLHDFLGIQVKKDRDGTVLSQEKHATKFIERAGMKNCKPMATPLSTSEKLSIEGGTQLGEQGSMRY